MSIQSVKVAEGVHMKPQIKFGGDRKVGPGLASGSNPKVRV